MQSQVLDAEISQDSGLILGLLVVDSRLIWSRFGVASGSIVGPFRIDPGSNLDGFGFPLQSIWDRFGVDPGSIQGRAMAPRPHVLFLMSSRVDAGLIQGRFRVAG